MKILAVLAVALASVVVSAQTPAPSAPGSLADNLRKTETRVAKNLIGAADAMPGDKYSYSPSPQQITFAHLMAHVAESNNHACSALGGSKAGGPQVSENDGKEKLAAAVKQSFADCEATLAHVTDANIQAQPDAFFHLVMGWADHYSMAAMYLRLNNLVPPSAQK